ncbi:FAD-dependent oxidoreductase [Porphyromonas sp. COT-108 OH1349]|uniref:FAD-dependent oxidoreductase n=1 Tax=Porphyromonas sp. COT-108 OH1349 TaxID=1537504 RepID=UPI00052E0EE3|nr:FAD-dependent oxidoreductase [Porphyromonas sp. COT-108 OH1349]KGN67834.1 pyridine nucleotide-disulfide oxidoreductase [Porphyromonas sp. COT-108 OH1349]
MKYVIVGGVAGGATAAARLRRLDEHAEIVLFEKGKYISYANCGLPYHIGGVIEERDMLFLQTPQSFSDMFHMDIRVESEVLRIDRAGKQVEVRRADGTTYMESYDKLLLSPGAVPVVPPLPGIDSPGVFTLRNVEDMDAIKHYLDSHKVKKAVVVGGGFIGLEMAENLHARHIEVSVVEMAPQVMAPIDFSLASVVHAHMHQKGVGLYLGKAVTAIRQAAEGSALSLSLDSGETLDADLILLSIGVRPNSKLAEDAGLEIGEARGIKVDDYLQTSDPDIFAVGDAIEFRHPITGKSWTNYLAGPANRQARIVAGNMSGLQKQTYEGAIGTAIAKVFDLTVASTGLAAKAAKREGLPYLTATVQPNSHAGYYPNAFPLTLKIVFHPETGRLYGAQCVGVSGVDKRIDSIAQIIKHEGTIYDLMKTEQAYAPPFSSAKDPVALAGYVAENIISGKMKPLYWREMQAADPKKVTIVDVRPREAYDVEHISGSMHIPLEEMRFRHREIPKDKPVYIYCTVGFRGYLSSNILLQNGFTDVYNLIGGYRLYSAIVADYSSKPENTFSQPKASADTSATVMQVNACGLACPGPILKLKQSIDKINVGERLAIESTDPGFSRDAQAWCDTTGHTLIAKETKGGKFVVTVEKTACKAEGTCVSTSPAKGKTFILFSDSLDKALATFVLANGAAATGQKVTIFFTFWGLNAIKRRSRSKVTKDFWGRMFGYMMPKDSKGLGLSKMNMGGLGAKMMRFVMKKRHVDSLESMRAQALENGVEFIACQMSMDVMGVDRKELIEEVSIGGVATYMNRADDANINLFI